MNTKSDEFLWKTMALNVLLLWSYNEAVLQAKSAISHSHCHFFAVQLLDISLLVKYMIDDFIFDEELGCISI